MGKEPESLHFDEFDEFPPLTSPDYKHHTATTLGDKIYVIVELRDGSASSICVGIFDKPSRRWVFPTVLGGRPASLKRHSTMVLNGDRIVVINESCPLDDAIWFLEIGTPFVKDHEKKSDIKVVAWSKGVIGNCLKPVVISGPSGVGKGTLISKLLDQFPSEFGFSVSHTTRSPREKEIDGVHYHFTKKAIMEMDILDGKFLETAAVHGNLYGTSIEAVERVTDAGRRCILDIDVQGARSVRASPLEADFIFISPPDVYELEKRLRARGTETEEQIKKRLKNANTELEQSKTPGLFDVVLCNDNLEACYKKLKVILGLDGTKVDTLPQRHMGCTEVPNSEKSDSKISICCFSDELGTKRPFVLDVSLIKCGAPGRTRGLEIAIEKS